MKNTSQIRQASLNDRNLVDDLIQFAPFYHRHLDWIGLLEWLGHQPFWLIEDEGEIQAVFGCPVDPPWVAWIRIFASRSGDLPTADWYALLERVMEEHQLEQGCRLAVLGLHPWTIELAEQTGFVNYQNIVTLEWDEMSNSQPEGISADFHIRPMRESDLPVVAEIDSSAFAPLWRNSLSDITRSFPRSGYATVIENSGEIAGFQISTTTPISAHLARLAVLPKYQRQSLGFSLVKDLLDHSLRHGYFRVTVNTQHDNFSSLALYRKLGFTMTGEEFRVFVKQVS